MSSNNSFFSGCISISGVKVSSMPGKMRKVLVVDDERLVADTLSLIFRKRGYDSRAAYSGADAVECAREFGPELLLCDMSMPGMDGLEVVNAIAGEHPACRVLMLTGHYSNVKKMLDHSHSLLNPMGVITKPIQPEDLLEQAGQMLSLA